MTAATTDTARLRRIQTGARATLALGIGASLTANILAAHPSLIGRLVAGWSPLALLLTVELLSRVPTTSSRLSRLRVVAAGAIAAIAAWVSYWHMAEVSLSVGESPIAAHLLPLSVDGLVVVASICLVEISNHLNPGRSAQRLARPPAAAGASGVEGQANGATSAAASRGQTGAASIGTDQRSSVGDRVRQLAAQNPDWTQAQLAEAAECSVRTIRRHLSPSPGPIPAQTTEPTARAGIASDDHGTTRDVERQEVAA